MDADALRGFLALDLLLVLTPGADWAYAIAAGVRDRAVVAAVAGLAAGYVLHAALVTVGVGAVLARHAGLLTAMTLVGAVYLVGLGVATFRDPPAPRQDPGVRAGSRARTFAQGAAVSGLNPKGLLLFFAVLPQFVRPEAPWSPAVQTAVLGALHVAACAAVYLGVAVAARGLLQARPRLTRVVGRGSGAAMAGVGVVLAVGHVV